MFHKTNQKKMVWNFFNIDIEKLILSPSKVNSDSIYISAISMRSHDLVFLGLFDFKYYN